MQKGFRTIGIFFGSLWLISFSINIYQQIFQYSRAFPDFLFSSYALINLGIAGVFFASAIFVRLVWIQAIIFFALTPMPLLESGESFYGLGFFVVGVILLFRLGFYEKRRAIKLTVTTLYLYGWELFAALKNGTDVVNTFGPIFFITTFLVFLYLAFHEQLVVYLKEPKAKLSLTQRGLSAAERSYVLSLTRGKSPKEVAFDFEVSESTVRNTLSRAYKKLSVDDKSGLAALAEKCDLVE